MGLARLLPRSNLRAHARGARLPTVIAFANQKGGVAKTTTTLNLAVAFAEQGLKVLAVDLDPRAAGLGAAAVAVLVRAPLLAVIVVAAAAAALVRTL